MEEEKFIKRQRIYRTIMLMVLTAFITFIATSVLLNGKIINTTNGESLISKTDDSKLITEMKKIESLVKEYYLKDIDEDKAIESAVKGYVEGLGDKYSQYITQSQMEEYTAEILGKYEGIGAYLVANKEKNMVEIYAPMIDSPAEKAGLLAGDLIKSIDGKEYTAEQLNEASEAIKGKNGTTVKLEIVRGEENLTIEVTRGTIEMNPVAGKKLENDIGYISFTSFDEDTAEQFKTKLEDLKKQGINSLIIDLRDNSGGMVDTALKIADYFIEKDKTLLITVDKDGKEEIKKAETNPIIDVPIVILTNGDTASASEILVGALKDNKNAKTVGTKTYGKGVIQNFISMPDGSGLKITIAEYFTPNKNKINEVGIEPNEKVELPSELKNATVVPEDKDTQLQKAIEMLKNK